MPHEWITRPDPEAGAGVNAELHLWPYRSLPKRGFVTFVGITLGLVTLPLLAVVGTPILWALLPFIAAAIGAIWYALMRSYKDGSVVEQLIISPGRLQLTRHNPRGPSQHWEADPYWVTLTVHDEDGPVPSYLTLKGAGREVEVGAFLPEAERIEIAGELSRILASLHRS